MLHTVYSSAVYTVVCAFVSFTNIYWAPTMENKLISNLDVQPSMKVWLLRGQMLFQSSDYRKQGGTLFPCCESFRQEVGEKLGEEVKWLSKQASVRCKVLGTLEPFNIRDVFSSHYVSGSLSLTRLLSSISWFQVTIEHFIRYRSKLHLSLFSKPRKIL